MCRSFMELFHPTRKPCNNLRNNRETFFMKHIVVLAQLKGGVGKTTMAVNLATMMKELEPDETIVIADADPLGQASRWLGYAQFPDVQVVQVNQNSLDIDLKKINADVIILDLPAVLDPLWCKSIELASILLVPVCPSILDVSQLGVGIRKIRETFVQGNTPVLVVPNRIDNRNYLSHLLVEELKDELKNCDWINVSKTSLGYRIAFVEWICDGVGVNQSARNSEAFHEIKSLAIEVLGILNTTR